MTEMALRIDPDDRQDDLPRALLAAREERAARASAEAPPRPVVVTGLRIGFFALVGFFLKCAVAAIPALLLLGAVSYGLGYALDALLPDWVKLHLMVG